MIRINLLPFRAARSRENVRAQVSVFILSVIFVSISLFYFGTILSKKVDKMDADILAIKNEIVLYEKKAREVDLIRKKLAVLKKKMDVIQSLETNRREPIIVFEALTELIIPKRMWLTSLNFSGSSLSIDGIALDEKTVADFMTQLEASPLFGDVNLVNLEQEKMKDEVNLKRFSINSKKITKSDQNKAKS